VTQVALSSAAECTADDVRLQPSIAFTSGDCSANAQGR
jgi:hypothetical protein